MNYKTLFLGMFLFLFGQVAAWYQTNGQFISKWFKDNPFLTILIFAFPVGYAYIEATRLIASTFDGQVWPTRLLGFAMGILAFSFLTYFHLNEGITLKTGVILILATLIILIQVFWR
jgi:hypothetical protein